MTTPRLIALLCAGVWMSQAVVVAAAPKGDKVTETKSKPQSAKSITKIRSGSYLRRQRPKLPPPDIRGEFERRRDDEVIRHYRRMAVLAVIEEVANNTEDVSLASRVESVRRSERDRFRLAMQRLRRVMRAKASAGFQ